MSPRLKLDPKWKNEKAKGELIEMAFQLKASALGLAVSKPYGDNQPFDFTVYTLRTGSMRVQVKSGWSRWRIGFKVKPYRSGRGPGDGYDFLVVYIPPHDAWYIIPADDLRDCTMAYFYPHRRKTRGRFEGFRDAWHLLTGDHSDDTRLIGLTIHANADESANTTLLEKPEKQPF